MGSESNSKEVVQTTHTGKKVKLTMPKRSITFPGASAGREAYNRIVGSSNELFTASSLRGTILDVDRIAVSIASGRLLNFQQHGKRRVALLLITVVLTGFAAPRIHS